jgi:hypothetical protein
MLFRSLGRRPAALLRAVALSFVFAAPAHALDPLLPPSGNFDLKNWKITLPSGSEIQPWLLSSGWTMANVFYTHPTSGGMVFRCPNIAGTTANSTYSRTELREMLDPTVGTRDAANNWTTALGGRMKARLKVDRVSTTGESGKVGRIIIGQIHGSEHEPARLYFHKKPGEAKGRIYLATESTSGSTSWSTDIVPNTNGEGVALGELFTYVITLKDTRLQIDIIRKSGAVTNTYIKYIDSGYRSDWMYFKAGLYNQNNTGTTSDYAQVTFYSLTHTHP